MGKDRKLDATGMTRLANARKAMNLGEPIHSDPIDRAIAKANASHYSEVRPKRREEPPTFEIKKKADIKNSKHRASAKAMDKFKDLLKDSK